MKNVRPIAPKPKRSMGSDISLNKTNASSFASSCSLRDSLRRDSRLSFNLEQEIEISEFSKELNEYQEIETVSEELFRILTKEEYINDSIHINRVPRSSNPFLRNFELCE
jgi:hypothetical protein